MSKEKSKNTLNWYITWHSTETQTYVQGKRVGENSAAGYMKIHLQSFTP